MNQRALVLFLGAAAIAALLAAAFAALYEDRAEIDDFEECAAYGYPIAESYPRQCRTPDGRVFIEELDVDDEDGDGEEMVPPPAATPKPPPSPLPPVDKDICVDRCGNGQCEEIVCLGTGCPCAETPSACPVDCPDRY